MNTDYYNKLNNYRIVQAEGFLAQASKFANEGKVAETRQKLNQLHEIRGELSPEFLVTIDAQIAEIERVIRVYENTPKALNIRTCQPNCAKIALGIVGLLSLTFFPVPTLCLAAAAIACKVYSQNFGRTQVLQNQMREVSQERALKVELNGARQYDMKGDIPAACTFHALEAVTTIAQNFDNFVRLIENKDSKSLSLEQKNILQRGLNRYNIAVEKNPTFIRGADAQHIIQNRFAPEGLILKEKESVFVDPNNLQQTIETEIAGHLFKGSRASAFLMKTLNDLSFACISDGKKAIIFDSHLNEIILSYGKENFIKELKDKLSPDLGQFGMLEGLATIDVN